MITMLLSRLVPGCCASHLAKPIKLILNFRTVKPLSRFLEAIFETKFESYGTPPMERPGSR